MADRPIIFSAPMVRALLDGRKTQTRRVLRQFDPDCDPPYAGPYIAGHKVAIWTDREGTPWRYTGAKGAVTGDRLWVREAWTARMTHGWTIADARSRMYQEEILYRADRHDSIDGWWPSIHMPREFSRLTLTVTDVRVQRLQDISEEDAVAEGIERLENSKGPNHFTREITGKWSGSFNAPTAQEVFADLWNDINGPEAWGENPWVVALTFTVHRCNIDQMEASHG